MSELDYSKYHPAQFTRMNREGTEYEYRVWVECWGEDGYGVLSQSYGNPPEVIGRFDTLREAAEAAEIDSESEAYQWACEADGIE